MYGSTKIYVSPSLEVLKSNYVGILPLTSGLEFVHASHLRELHIAGNQLDTFEFGIRGLHNLSELDMSYNDARDIKESFFDYFPLLTVLNMKGNRLESLFLTEKSKRLFQPLARLHTLDLSENNVRFLSEGTFKDSPLLQNLYLSGNRFESLAFDVKFLPNLKHVDLTYNSIPHLTHREMLSLDTLGRSLTLNLTGNIITCACSSLKFLNWLKTTQVQVYRPMNLTCISEGGQLTTTAAFIMDTKALWRECYGQRALLLSLVVLCLIVIGFITTISVIKLQTRLKSFFFRLFIRGFILRQPSDYTIGVYIGYADAQYRFACFTLQEFVESKLQLSTYVKHKDSVPGVATSEAYVDALNSSWRIVLIITQDYIDRELWSHFEFKTASYTVSPSNPGLVLLLVAESCRSQVPECLLAVVEEDCIIWLADDLELTPDVKQRLRLHLLPSYNAY